MRYSLRNLNCAIASVENCDYIHSSTSNTFMRRVSAILMLTTFATIGCGQNQASMKHAPSDYYSNNEDKFGFLVFDKLQVDTFFLNYSPIEFNNGRLREACNNLLNFGTINKESKIVDFSRNTRVPTSSDYELASDVLRATNEKDGEKYFYGSVKYLFFFNCLPNKFRYKWSQTLLGDFEFNVTFFNLIRTHCKVFDKTIYGDTGYCDENIQSVFEYDVLSEISVENARVIKDCIVNDAAFSDARIKSDKENFIMFLDKVVQKQWRLFLLDNN
jgi:hypothetical protein